MLYFGAVVFVLSCVVVVDVDIVMVLVLFCVVLVYCDVFCFCYVKLCCVGVVFMYYDMLCLCFLGPGKIWSKATCCPKLFDARSMGKTGEFIAQKQK